ncbi:MAG: N-acetylmuramoyl-L-alanine amidase [Sphingomonas adhaesiva]|uniref:N-acetylmuramoyl-L-alanine amidase n=1 Tax=Sphingomonas adhaesiva TaxID=28212 RepID=UPI002FFD2C97
MSFAFVIALLATLSPARADTVERVEVGEGNVVIRFDSAVTRASGFLLPAPDRIAIDVDGITPGARIPGSGAVAQVRQGRRDSGTRIVLDLAQPMVIEQGELRDEGRSLALTLRPTDKRGFTAAAMAGARRFLPWNWGRDTPVATAASYKVTVPVPPPARAAPLPKVQGDDDRPLVVIDAGHGGNDPGAINQATGLREKDVTLRIARAIRDNLIAGGRVRVALTRNDDRYILHRERFGIARRLKADLFISIHCDSVGTGLASGATAYTLSDVASDKEAALLAARENKSDVIAGVRLDRNPDVSSILIDLTQRETMNASAGFARLLGREAKPLIPTKPNFHRTASLLVLKAPDMPSILFETGYISTPEDAAFLDSKAGREKIAESVRRAVEIYFARRLATR